MKRFLLVYTGSQVKMIPSFRKGARSPSGTMCVKCIWHPFKRGSLDMASWAAGLEGSLTLRAIKASFKVSDIR